MRNGKLVAAFAVLLVASFAAMNAMPSDTLLAALLQEAVLALVALVAVRFAAPDTLKRCTQTVQRRNAVRFAMIALLLTGLVGGAITLLTWYFANSGNGAGFVSAVLSSAADLMENLLFLLGICLLTGVYEEVFMRVLGIEAFESAMGEGGAAPRRAACEQTAGKSVDVSSDVEHGVARPSIALDTASKRAILASAALFALLHVGVPDISVGQLVFMQTALKFVQALLFSVILGVLYAQTRRLWPCALIHAGFDVLYLAPNVLLTGAMPGTYASGVAGDTVLLAVTVFMLAGIVIKIRKEIAR